MAQQTRISRLQAPVKKDKYSSSATGFRKFTPTSFPPQKRSSVPGFTDFTSIPPEPEFLMTEDNNGISTENNNNLIS